VERRRRWRRAGDRDNGDGNRRKPHPTLSQGQLRDQSAGGGDSGIMRLFPNSQMWAYVFFMCVKVQNIDASTRLSFLLKKQNSMYTVPILHVVRTCTK
jgi:hypothetical protein